MSKCSVHLTAKNNNISFKENMDVFEKSRPLSSRVFCKTHFSYKRLKRVVKLRCKAASAPVKI